MYKKARSIFSTLEPGEELYFPRPEGLKIRAALHVIVGRNPNVPKQFKAKTIGNQIKIWRKI